MNTLKTLAALLVAGGYAAIAQAADTSPKAPDNTTAGNSTSAASAPGKLSTQEAKSVGTEKSGSASPTMKSETSPNSVNHKPPPRPRKPLDAQQMEQMQKSHPTQQAPQIQPQKQQVQQKQQ